MCRQPSSVTLNVHSREREGEAADLGTVFQKGNLTSAFSCITVIVLYSVLEFEISMLLYR
jgi:hypothetical protein